MEKRKRVDLKGSRNEGRKSLSSRTMWKKLLRIFLKAIIYFNVFSILLVLVYKWVPIPITMTMIGEIWESEEDQPFNYDWVSYEEMDDHLKLAAIASEDQKFPEHWGFDWESMKKAYESNKKGKKLRGASTISQQVAKNVFLWQGRSYIRKGLEVYYTFLIELLWSKERILEVYLNVAETGICTFGVEEGCKRYWKHGAQKTGQYKAAQLISILPNPSKWNIGNGKRTQHVFRQMNNLGLGYLKELE